MTRLERFVNKVRAKAMLTQEQINLLSRDMWHCNKCGHDLHVSKFNFHYTGDLLNTCKYCKNNQRNNENEKAQASQTNRQRQNI